jgi:LmbE family N-acetylglucosaminyl deacetylase
MINAQRILVLAPHTDDGELGCGGSLAHIVREAYRMERPEVSVYYLAFSWLPEFKDGVLKDECTEAAKKFDATVEYLEFPVRRFSEFRQEILDKLIAVNRSFRPDLVFAPSKFDIHQDHQAVTAEALRAFKHTTILGYETPWNNYQFEPNFYIQLSGADVEIKIEAVRCYRSQNARNYTAPDFIRSLARMRGIQVNGEFAEAFHAMRVIS